MKKSIMIFGYVLIIICCISLYFFNKKSDDNELDEYKKLKENYQQLDKVLKKEIENIGNVDLDIDNKISELEKLAKETEQENNNTLSNDILLDGISDGSKYTGEACKEICW